MTKVAKQKVNYSDLRKETQVKGGTPSWFTTGGVQLFYEKYSYQNETVRSRFLSIAKALAQHAPDVYPDWWENDPYTKGKTYTQVFFNSMWDGYISASTPLLANGGLRKRGTTVSCLTGESLILTKHNGCKRIKDIIVGDEVLTHKGRWRKVTHTQNRMSDRDLYTLTVDTRNTPIHITGNHPVLTNLGWVKVEDLDPNTHLIATNSDLEITEKPFSIELDTESSEIKHSIATPINNNVDVDSDLAWAIGLWVSEGNLNRYLKDNDFGRVIRVTMSQNEICHLERFGQIFKEKFGVNYKVNLTEHNGHKWATCTVNSVYLANYFGSKFGTSCLTKTIPREIIDLPKEQVMSFLKGVYEGEGRKSSGKKELTPDIRLSNHALVSQLYEMSLKVGMKVSLKLDVSDGRNSKNNYSCLSYFNGGFTDPREFSLRNHNRAIKFGNLRYCKFVLVENQNDELVYDITVEEDESFSVAGVVVHNCAGGNVGNNLFDRYNAITEAAILTKHSHGTSYCIDEWPHEGWNLPRGGTSHGVMPLVRDFISCMEEVTQASRRGSLAYSIRPQHPDANKVLEYLYENTESNNVGWLIDDEFNSLLNSNDPDATEFLGKSLSVKLKRGKGYYTFISKMNRHLAEAFKRKGMKVKASNLC